MMPKDGQSDAPITTFTHSPVVTSIFLSRLPVEVRLQIHRLVLALGTLKPFAPETTKKLSQSTALLRVCQTTYIEGRPILLENNLFFRRNEALKRFLATVCSGPQLRFAVKAVEIAFDWVATTPEINMRDMLQAQEEQWDLLASDLGDLSLHTMGATIHRKRKKTLREETWQEMVNLVLENLQPKRLTLDLTCAVDESGCCSLQSSALSTLLYGVAGKAPEGLRLKGLKGFEDREHMRYIDELVLHVLRMSIEQPEPVSGRLIHAKTGEALIREARAEVERDIGFWLF